MSKYSGRIQELLANASSKGIADKRSILRDTYAEIDDFVAINGTGPSHLKDYSTLIQHYVNVHDWNRVMLAKDVELSFGNTSVIKGGQGRPVHCYSSVPPIGRITSIVKMVKHYENSIIFQFNWNQVAQGFWQRYPNPNSSHVLSEDTVSREVKDGVLYTTRLMTKTHRVPKWGERFINMNTVKIVEESVVDPKTKTLTTYTRNLGYTKVMSIVEKIVYKVSEENSNWTVAIRSAWIDSQVFGFSRAIQAYGLDRFKKNCLLMYSGFNYVLAHMFPHTAQYMNPTLAQMGFAHLLDEGLGIRSSLAEDFQHSLQGKAEKVKDAAKKATDLAKKKAGPLYVACQPQQS